MCFRKDDVDLVTAEMLREACEQKRVKKLRRWGKRGVRVTGPELLCLMASLCHTDVLRCLVLHLGANVNHPGPDGWTPLQISAARGHLQGVKCLVEELDADVYRVREATGSTALSIAVARNEVAVVRYLEREILCLEEAFC